MRPAAAAWLAASTLSIGAAIVTIIVMRPHWQAREVDWMVGGAVVLVALAAALQACFRRANRGSSLFARDVSGEILGRIDELRENRQLLEESATALEALRRADLLDADDARSLDQLNASLDNDAARQLDEHARILRRDLQLANVLAWTLGAIATLLLLEMR